MLKTRALTLLLLALTACSGPAPADLADEPDDGAADLATRTFDLSPAQARALGLSPQAATAPVSVTLAVKIGNGNLPASSSPNPNTGKKRAGLTFAFAGKDFPAVLTGRTTGTYVLNLNDAAGTSLLPRPKTGTVNVTLAGQNLKRSRSSAYVDVRLTATCATATFALTLPDGSALGSGPAPLEVCESAGDARAALAAASDGLLYVSESDFPFTGVQLTSQPGPMPDAARFTSLIGMDRPGVELDMSVTFAALFDRLTTADPNDPASATAAKRYERLRKVFTQHYTDLRVYHVRDTLDNAARWSVYIVGVNAWGVSGLVTTSIET